MLDEQRAMRGELGQMRGELGQMRDDKGQMREELVVVRERGELTARAIEVTRQQLLAQLELARIDLLETITFETRSESIGTRRRVGQ